MKPRLAIFSFLLVLFFLKILPAFSQQITFSKVLPPEGNSFGFVTGITQDINGYMLFATQNGVVRYNGYHYTTYVHDSLNQNSLASNWVESIYSDKDGKIWFGTFGAGIDRLDPETRIFTHFSHDANDITSLSNDTVTAILRDKQGILWIGTHGGLNQFDSKKNTFIHYQYNSNDSTSVSSPKSWPFKIRDKPLT